MFHLVANARPRTFLFHDPEEGLRLWRDVHDRVGTPVASVVMPDHLHLLVRRDASAELSDAMRTYAQWVNARRGTSGEVFRPQARPLWVPESKRKRTERYILLNPVRGELVRDPLAWPFSSHRDAVGLQAEPVRRAVADPVGYHRWISSDHAGLRDGSELPLAPVRVDLDALPAAVCAAVRVPRPRLEARGPARSLLLRAARVLGDLPPRLMVSRYGVSRSTAHRIPTRLDAEIQLVARLAGDPRFQDLAFVGDLRSTSRFRRYFAEVMVPLARKLERMPLRRSKVPDWA